MKIQHVLIAGLISFALGAFDSVLNKATKFSELSLFGKSFTVVFCLCLVYLVIVSIVGLVKKRK
jgi:hypothetical protein